MSTITIPVTILYRIVTNVVTKTTMNHMRLCRAKYCILRTMQTIDSHELLGFQIKLYVSELRITTHTRLDNLDNNTRIKVV